MKKLLVLLFSTLLLGSVCFAEQTPVNASDLQGKAVENKKKESDKRPVRPPVKRSGKKIQKVNKPVQKEVEPVKK